MSAGAVEFFDIKRKKIRSDNLRVAQSIFEEFLVQWTMSLSFPAATILHSKDISQKAEEISVEEQHFDEYLLTVTNKQILLSACMITGLITQNAADPIPNRFFL
jgi:hypothetical protein